MNNRSSEMGQIISLPNGGGNLSGLGEKFSPDLHTGTGNFTIPIVLPSGRNGLQPQLSLGYSTGSGNSPFGLGWGLNLPCINRKTDRGVPRYDENDIYILSGAEDLVVVEKSDRRTRYRPRTEGLFALIEHHRNSQNNFWQIKSKDGLISIYGTPNDFRNDSALITHPQNNSQIYSWKLRETFDTYGNRIIYEYENDSGNENGRNYTQTYLKSIKYVDYDNNGNTEFLVQCFFDYEPRPDEFSEFRSGFEIRTRFRCKRILIKTLADTVRNVKAYDFIYQDKNSADFPANGVSLIKRIQVVGFDEKENEVIEMPSLDFSYSRFEPNLKNDLIRVGGKDFPFETIAESSFELVDVVGNGLPDLLQMNGVVRFWRNLGKGNFDLPKNFPDAPGGISLADKGVQMLDVNGDGQVDLMAHFEFIDGYFPMNHGAVWEKKSFRRFESVPSFDLQDAEVKLLDLTGDGAIDVLRSGSRLEHFFNDSRNGWKETRFLERKGLSDFPNVNFSDERVKLGDMSGDGLQDIVLIHDGNVEYWANLGWGNWSKRIQMRRNPRFPYGYNPKNILLGDVDGDGLADIVFVENNQVTIWLNQSGNSWSKPIVINGTPPISNGDEIRLIDLTASGVSGILWSLNANTIAGQRLYFLNLTGNGKAYLLNEVDNNLGAVTKIEYASSTEFYLQDARKAATKWQSNLPFPVQVVKKVEVIDEISLTKLTTEYKYHHGYWDGNEREFRGFGMVEQCDSLSEADFNSTGLHGQDKRFENTSVFSAPTLTKTWFYQGAVGNEEKWTEVDYSHEYFSGEAAFFPKHTSVTSLPEDSRIRRRIKRDALRAMRGSVLRTELYALDKSSLADKPYTVSESQIGVQEIEIPAAGNEQRQRIFFPHIIATRTTQWERGDDPLTQIQITNFDDNDGKFDSFGRPHFQITIALPRRLSKQKKLAGAINPNETRVLATCQKIEYAVPNQSNIYIHDRVSETKLFELKNPPTVQETNSNDLLVVLQDQLKAVDSVEKEFRQALNDNQNSSRLNLLGHTVNHYDGRAFEGLAAGETGIRGALVRREYLVFSEEMLGEIYQLRRPQYLGGNADLPNSLPNFASSSGYQRKPAHSVYYNGYYIDSLRNKYDSKGLIVETLDPVGNRTQIEYDKFLLLPIKVIDAANLQTIAENNYRFLQPSKITDVNQNSTVSIYNPSGLTQKIFLAGRNGEGGTESEPEIEYKYDFLNFQKNQLPIYVRTARRIHHVKDGVADEKILTCEYSDGFSRLVQTRTQAEEIIFGNQIFGGNFLPLDQNLQSSANISGRINNDSANPNVTVSGWQRYDNKGNVIEKYEPFFSIGFDYQPPNRSYFNNSQKIQMFYDPRGRLIETISPDGSKQKIVYGIPLDLTNPDIFEPTAWESYFYDENDNAENTHQASSVNYRHHWNTPSSTLSDALGRVLANTERNGNDAATEWYLNCSTYDIRGNLLTVIDALGREAFKYSYDLLNRSLRVKSIDAGLRTSVLDAVGNLLEFRDSRGSLVLREFDKLNRLKNVWARDRHNGDFTMREMVEYGDEGNAAARHQALQKNQLGKPVAHFDEAGVLRLNEYDFKGNLLQKTRQTISDADITNGWMADWSQGNAQNALETVGYTTSTKYDALNRPTEITYPSDVNGQQAVLLPTYNRAGMLQSVTVDGAIFVELIAYNAKSQRTLIVYGNGFLTRYGYDLQTFRLARMKTESFSSSTTSSRLTYQFTGNILQDFAYGYDLAGNILSISDRTPGSGVLNNAESALVNDSQLASLLVQGDALIRHFEYDAIYRLTKATGRESQNITSPRPFTDDARDGFNSGRHGTANRDNAPNLTAIYSEDYSYDPAGNMLQMRHTQGSQTWRRDFGIGGFNPQNWQQEWQNYLNMGANWGSVVGNQLTHVGNNQTHQFDENGNLIQENTERRFVWDYADRMIGFEIRPAGSSQASVEARYLYGADGMRVKKWVRKNGVGYETTTYIDSIFEHHRWRESGTAKENNHLHISDDQKRIALMRIGDVYPNDASPTVTYHFGDHLGSSNLAVGGNDSSGNSFINREEYFPYGETSFGSFGKKRFRFSGKERDEESGLYYFGMRFYAPHLCRWTSCDRLRSKTETSLFAYAANSPLFYVDRLGLNNEPVTSASPGTLVPRKLTPDEIEADKISSQITKNLTKLDQIEGDVTKLKRNIKGIEKWINELDVKDIDYKRKKIGLPKHIKRLEEEIEKLELEKEVINADNAELDKRFAKIANKSNPKDPPKSGGSGTGSPGLFTRAKERIKGWFKSDEPKTKTPQKLEKQAENGLGRRLLGGASNALLVYGLYKTAETASEVYQGEKPSEELGKELARTGAFGVSLIAETAIEEGPDKLEVVKNLIADSIGADVQNRAANIAAQQR